MRAPHRPAWVICVLLAMSTVQACARIPEGRYGVNRLRLEGMEEMDEYALSACLATHERGRMALNIGRTDAPECGEAPFDGGRLRIPFWRWPWTDWPVFDRVTFDRDIQRIERWYRARGYYDAEVTQVSFEPGSSGEDDRFEDDERPCDSGRAGRGCEVDLAVHIDEGLPVRVASVTIAGIRGLSEELREEIREAIQLEIGQRADESEHEATKEAFVETLREASYACATVTGRIQINPEEREAAVSYTIDSGPRARIGLVTLVGAEGVPQSTIRATAGLQRGDLYRQSDIVDAQRAIYALGAFASVTIEPELSREACADEIPIRISVTRGRDFRTGFGLGMQVGVDELSDDNNSTDQWDLHLRALIEHRNFLGGLRRIRIEDRPRLIFLSSFPGVRDQNGDVAFNIGNHLSIDFRQPAFVEPQTFLTLNLSWDLGPDNYNLNFRHNLESQIRLERSLWGGRITVSGGIHGNLVRYISAIATDEDAEGLSIGGSGTPPDYHLLFLEQYFRLDLRDNPRRPRSGLYVALGAHETGYFMPSSWDYIRFTGDVRFYIPLPLGMVLASRFSIGMMHITDIHVGVEDPQPGTCGGIDCSTGGSCGGNPTTSECQLVSTPDAESEFGLCQYGQLCLGPDEYRLRGGGAMGNRGFAAGGLGDPGTFAGLSAANLATFDDILGGTRRWEASVELRMPLSDSLETALFLDAGDVNRLPHFRFDYLHLTVGMGIRYQTIVGPIRLDVGYRLPHLQVIGSEYPELASSGFWDRTQIHITIGEAF